MTLQLVCKSYSTFVILFHSIHWFPWLENLVLQAKGQREKENSKGDRKGEGGTGNGKQGEGRRRNKKEMGENYEEKKGNEELGQCKCGKRKRGEGGKHW